MHAIHRSLAAAFILYGSGERERGYALLGKMSLSFASDDQVNSKLDHVRSYEIDIDDADEVLANIDSYPEVPRAVAVHDHYLYTWVVALLEFAREKGEVAPSRFIWLRPVDRTLWYALNQLGGKKPHFEAASVWAHMDAEEVMGKTITTPEIKTAVQMFEYELRLEGWLKEKDNRP